MKTNPLRMCKSFNSHLPAECSTLRTDKFHKSPLELSSVQYCNMGIIGIRVRSWVMVMTVSKKCHVGHDSNFQQRVTNNFNAIMCVTQIRELLLPPYKEAEVVSSFLEKKKNNLIRIHRISYQYFDVSHSIS